MAQQGQGNRGENREAVKDSGRQQPRDEEHRAAETEEEREQIVNRMAADEGREKVEGEWKGEVCDGEKGGTTCTVLNIAQHVSRTF